MKTVTSRDGTSIAFDVYGSGPALILVGGALSTRSAVPKLAGLLAPHFTVFGYDRRGRGDSGDTPPYAVEREVEDIAALIEIAGGKAFIYGHSSGAALSLQAAAHGLAIDKLAVYEAPFIVDAGRRALPDDYVAHLTELTATGRRREALEYFFTVALEMPEAAVAQMHNDPSWPAFEAIAHTLAYDGTILQGRMSGTPLVTSEFAAIKMPTLVLAGALSPGWRHSSARALTAALLDARLITLDGQAHGAAPETLAPVLIDFFAV
jgi:pimeloyl-ACP methyl ester carboxylesterase